MKRQKNPTKVRVERHISAALRIAMAALTFLLQIGIVVAFAVYARKYFGMLYIFLDVLSIIMAIRIFNRSGSTSYKIGWVFLVLAVPVAGIILYLLWGGEQQAKRLSLKRLPPPVERESSRREAEESLQCLGREYPSWGRLAAYLQKKGFLLYRDTEVRYFPTGEQFFRDLLTRMRQAERYIFLEYYILAEGQLWDNMLETLRERSAAGVEIKIVFDDFGNITRLSGDMLRRIQEAGIEVQIFNPVHKYVNRLYFNYRDHRKIAAIDGCFAYTGGVNIADEYANLIERFGYWKDTGVCLSGEGAWGLTAQFIHMWEMMGGVLENELDYYRPIYPGKGAGYCQTVVDGPINNPENPAEDVYLQLIASARRMLYITTPYLAIEESMVKALCIAGDGGVDVRLMLPAIPDKKTVYMVAETYFGELMKHGVKIYRYLPGFLHAKSVMVDREVALVGTTNMDYRSFQLHHECAVLFYGAPAVEALLEDMDDVMAKSAQVTLEEWERRGWLKRVLETLLKLFAIWM